MRVLASVAAEPVKILLRNLATKVPDKARKTMHRAAARIEVRAKLFAPVDLGNLVDSIHQEVSYGGRGRLQIDIVAGGVVDGVDVDDYVAMIHENYESLHPGPGTIAKRLANPGVYIGSKFLERAYEEEREKLHADMIEAINGAVAESVP